VGAEAEEKREEVALAFSTTQRFAYSLLSTPGFPIALVQGV
jgi:hypothetical protein